MHEIATIRRKQVTVISQVWREFKLPGMSAFGARVAALTCKANFLLFHFTLSNGGLNIQ